MKPAHPPEAGSSDVELLARSERGDGRHRVLKLRLDGRPAVLKCYGRKTARTRACLRQFGSLALVGKSSISPRGRRRTEAEALALWRREGFDVPRVLAEAPPPGFEGPGLLLEWIRGESLADLLRHRRGSPEGRRAILGRFAALLGKRHARALELREPRLLFEHPTLEHVLVEGERLVHIDLEIVFRRRRSLERIVRREIAGFLHSLAKTSGDEFPSLLDAVVEGYPDRDRLVRVLVDLRRFRAVPVSPWLEAAQCLLRSARRYRKRSGLVESLDRALGKSPVSNLESEESTMRSVLALLACLALAAAPAVARAQTESTGAQPAGEAAAEAPADTEASSDLWVKVQTFDLENLFEIRIPEDELTFDFGGRFVLDFMKYSYANDRHSGLEVDDLRLTLDLHVGPFRFWVEPDFLGVDTLRNLWEAWASFQEDPTFRLSVGQFRVPLATEFATREEHLPLVGYSFPSYLDGRYDVGVRVDGTVLDEGLWYQGAMTVGNGFDLEGERYTNPQFSARLTAHPFRWIDAGWEPLEGIYVGVGLAVSPDGDIPLVLANPFESIVFRTGRLDGDSTWWRHLEAGWALGPVRVGWETVTGAVNDVPVGGGRTEDFDQLGAWTAYASWNLTGENQLWKDGGWTNPEAPDSEEPNRIKIGDWAEIRVPRGRWEIGARYSNADMDRGLFDYGFATYDTSTQEVRTFTLDLFWSPNPAMRLGLGWVKTIADDDIAAFGGTDRDSSYVARLEIAF